MYLWNRKLLDSRLKKVDLSQREIAAMVGWRSHTIFNRIVRGEVNTVEDKRAVRLAYILGVGVDDLFEARSSTGGQQTVTPKRTKVAA
jgi:transcriptional regulator with XRE-family HTH domain